MNVKASKQHDQYPTNKAMLEAVEAKLKAEGFGLRKIRNQDTYVITDPENCDTAIDGNAMTIEDMYDDEIGGYPIYKCVFVSLSAAPYILWLRTEEGGKLTLITHYPRSRTPAETPVNTVFELITIGNRLVELGAERIARQVRGTTND